LPLAPLLFSTTKVWPSFSLSSCARIRAMISVEPPAGNGTTRLTGRVGHACDIAAAGTKIAAATRTPHARLAARMPNCIIIESPTLGSKSSHCAERSSVEIIGSRSKFVRNKIANQAKLDHKRQAACATLLSHGHNAMMLPALTTLHALLTEQPDVDADQIRDAISGTICSCTGYVPIVEAALEARAACRRTEGGRP